MEVHGREVGYKKSPELCMIPCSFRFHPDLALYRIMSNYPLQFAA